MGKTVKYNYIPLDVYSKFEFPGAEELGNMFEVQRLYVKGRQNDVEQSKKLYPGIRTFEEWMKENKDKFTMIK